MCAVRQVSTGALRTLHAAAPAQETPGTAWMGAAQGSTAQMDMLRSRRQRAAQQARTSASALPPVPASSCNRAALKQTREVWGLRTVDHEQQAGGEGVRVGRPVGAGRQLEIRLQHTQERFCFARRMLRSALEALQRCA
jgi:hypothetical protein